MINTGFNGELCLPKSILGEFGFALKGTMDVKLADGSLVNSQVYEGEIIWFGKKRKVFANQTRSKDSLLGTMMLIGCILKLDIERGEVTLIKN